MKFRITIANDEDIILDEFEVYGKNRIEVQGKTTKPTEIFIACLIKDFLMRADFNKDNIEVVDHDEEAEALAMQLAEEKECASELFKKRVHCDWLPVAEENREAFPDSIKFHEAHGDDLSECDAWVCDCGNGTGGHGFYPSNELGEEVEPDENWAFSWLSCCAECLTLYNRSGVEVESKRDKDDESDKRKKIN
jgi:hypothetical protein